MKQTEQNLKKFYPKLRYSGNNEQNEHLQITFLPTTECNFRCSYCYEYKKPEFTKIESGLKLVDMLFSIQDHDDDFWHGFFSTNKTKNHIVFNFFGGECLLGIDFMDAVVQRFVDNCNKDLDKYQKRLDQFQIIVQTNGYLLNTQPVVDFFSKWEKYILSCAITIDGCKEQHDMCRRLKDGGGGTWDIVHENILNFKKFFPKIPLDTKGTYSTKTVQYLYKSYQMYKEMGFKEFRNTVAIEEGNKWSDENLNELRHQFDLIIDDLLETNPNESMFSYPPFTGYHNQGMYDDFCNHGVGTCGSSSDMITLTPRDEICTCQDFSFFILGPNKESITIGNINDGIDIAAARDFQKKISEIFPKCFGEENGKCQHCTAKPLCETCPALMIRKENKYDGNYDVEECDPRKIENIAIMKYNYLKEKKAWEAKRKTAEQKLQSK